MPTNDYADHHEIRKTCQPLDGVEWKAISQDGFAAKSVPAQKEFPKNIASGSRENLSRKIEQYTSSDFCFVLDTSAFLQAARSFARTYFKKWFLSSLLAMIQDILNVHLLQGSRIF